MLWALCIYIIVSSLTETHLDSHLADIVISAYSREVTPKRKMRFRAVMRKLEAEHPEGVTAGEMFLSNTDLLPVSEEKKTWNHMSFVRSSFNGSGLTTRFPSGLPMRARWHTTEWLTYRFNLNTFTIASSMITAGMTWWQAFMCVLARSSKQPLMFQAVS